MTRTAVVTGATGGIGTAITRALVDRGDRVLALGSDAGRLKELRDAVPDVVPVEFDLREPSRLPSELASLERLDVFVHCAAVAEVVAVADATPQLWRDTYAVNVWGAAELIRAMLPAMRRCGARLIFINGAPGLHAVPRWSAYVGSKVALRELADSLRQEEAAHGLRVTTVYPGGTATERLRLVREQFGRPFDPASCIRPESLASLVVTALESPDDAYLTEVSVLPTPR